MSFGRFRSPLGSVAAPSTSDDSKMREKAESLWRQFGIVVIWPDQAIPWDMRGIVESAATKLYGPKAKRDG